MTVRSVIIGLFAAVLLASLGYINDTWFYFSYIGGDLLPTHAFGLLVLGLLLANPALRLLGRWQFKGSEWTVMLSLAFMGSVLAGSALYWQAPHPFITPIHEQMGNPGWKERDLMQYVPRAMLADARPATPDAPAPPALENYMQGLGHKGGGMAPLGDVPWGAWAPTLSFWTALLGLSFIGGAAAVVVVHRQWSKREQLAYPIVTFSNELIGTETDALGQRRVSIFRKRLFWIGLGVSLGILLVNGYYAWDNRSIQVSTGIDCRALRELAFFEALYKVPGVGNQIMNLHFYFAAIGIAYFLSSEASFSMGISGWMYALAVAPLIARGTVDMSRTMLGVGIPSYMYFGAYLGLGLTVLYLGRRFYWAVFRRAFFFIDPRNEVLPREAAAMRIMLVVAVALVALLWAIGLHPLLAAAFVVLSGLMFLMMARVNASTGLFMMQPFWQPVSIMLGLFGAAAIGPHALAIMAVLCTIVSIDTRIAAVPMIANALKLGDDQKVRPGWLAGWMSVAIVAALVISLIFTIWLVYSYGVAGLDSDGTKWALEVARKPFKLVNTTMDKLEANYQLAEARKGTSLLTAAKGFFPDRADYFFTATTVGVVLVLGCSWLRLRFPRWPLHPAVFLVWGQSWVADYAPSFLAAWLAKGLIMKYGGQKMYEKAKSFFIGLVAGELIAALFWGVVGAVYYLVTGTEGQHFLTRP